MSGKNDIFVGNITHDTTEEQLREIFGIGPIKNIRILIDKDTGRTKGFAFIEYHEANAALTAIRTLDGRELNGRKLRVSFSNNSNLRDLARASGLDVMDLQKEFPAVSNLSLAEAWDILESMKAFVEEDKSGAKTRALLDTYPQLFIALEHIQRRLGIVSVTQGGMVDGNMMLDNNSSSSSSSDFFYAGGVVPGSMSVGGGGGDYVEGYGRVAGSQAAPVYQPQYAMSQPAQQQYESSHIQQQQQQPQRSARPSRFASVDGAAAAGGGGGYYV